jgi:hypothetical protein
LYPGDLEASYDQRVTRWLLALAETDWLNGFPGTKNKRNNAKPATLLSKRLGVEFAPHAAEF